MNPHIKLTRVGMVYPLDPHEDLHSQLCKALVYHTHKYGEAHTIVVNPQVTNQTGDLVIESRDNGAVYSAEIIVENSIGRKRMLIS